MASNNSGDQSVGIADEEARKESAHGKKHRLSSSDLRNSTLKETVGSDLNEPQIQRLRKKIKIIKPMSAQLESELQAKGESAGAGSGNGQLGSSSEEGPERSADLEQSARNPPDAVQRKGAVSEALPSEPPGANNQANEDQEKGPALGQVHNSLHAIYAWYNSSRNAYLEQVKSYIEIIERQNTASALIEGKLPNNEEIDAVQRAVEVSIQIMRASAEVEARQKQDWMMGGNAPSEVPAARQ